MSAEGRASGWERLGRAVAARRGRLAVTQMEIQDRGGPSVATLNAIENAGRTSYRRSTLHGLDKALGWPEGTADHIVDGSTPAGYVGPFEDWLQFEIEHLSDPDVLGERVTRSIGGRNLTDLRRQVQLRAQLTAAHRRAHYARRELHNAHRARESATREHEERRLAGAPPPDLAEYDWAAKRASEAAHEAESDLARLTVEAAADPSNAERIPSLLAMRSEAQREAERANTTLEVAREDLRQLQQTAAELARADAGTPEDHHQLDNAQLQVSHAEARVDMARKSLAETDAQLSHLAAAVGGEGITETSGEAQSRQTHRYWVRPEGIPSGEALGMTTLSGAGHSITRAPMVGQLTQTTLLPDVAADLNRAADHLQLLRASPDTVASLRAAILSAVVSAANADLHDALSSEDEDQTSQSAATEPME